MNKVSKTTMLICSSVFGVIAIAILAGGGGDSGAFIGLTALLLSLIYLIVGIILAIIKESRNAGMGMLLTAGIMLLVGFTVCSISTGANI
jgi:uncharacterized membrane protein